MLRITDVGIKDAPVVLATVATEFGSGPAEAKLALTTTLLHMQHNKRR